MRPARLVWFVLPTRAGAGSAPPPQALMRGGIACLSLREGNDMPR